MGSCQVWCSFLSVVDADVNYENAISILTVVFLTTITEVPEYNMCTSSHIQGFVTR